MQEELIHKYQSVTIDFLKSLPDLDVENNRNHLIAGLFALGFDIEKKIDRIEDVLVRYRHSPCHARKTVVYQGQLRKDYLYKSIYNSHDILDCDARDPKCDKEFNIVVDLLQSESKQVVTDLPFEIPDYTAAKGEEKQYSRSPAEKAKYTIMNPQDLSLSELIKREELFVSPFEE